MRSLYDEAKNKEEPRFVVLSFLRHDGTTISRRVHAPIAAHESEFVRARINTLIGTGPVQNQNKLNPTTGPVQNQNHINVDVGEQCNDEATLEAVISWMYFSDTNESNEEGHQAPSSLRAALKLMRVASYLDMPGLQRHCSAYFASWTNFDPDGFVDVSDDLVRQCTDLWFMLSTTTIQGPAGAARTALMRMLMQRSTDNQVVVDLLRGCSLENLALLTTRVSCTARAVDLALAWLQMHAADHHPSGAVLAHIPLESLPVCYIRSLLDSGRLALPGDKHRAQMHIDALQEAPDPPAQKKAKKAKKTKEVPMPTVGWAGTLNGRLSTVDSELASGAAAAALGVHRLGRTGIRCEVEGHNTINQAALVDGKVLFFFNDRGMMMDTGYVHSASGQSTWHPFGIVPRDMVGEQYGSAVYGTWVIFVRMTGLGPSCVAFDVAKCTWHTMPAMTAREWPCVAVVDDCLYVIGGESMQAADTVPTERIRLDRCLCLNEAGGAGRRADGGAGRRADVGAHQAHQAHQTHQAHQAQQAQWEQVDMPLERSRCSAVAIDKVIYVSGGRQAAISSDLTRIDTVAGTVDYIGRPMRNARCCHGSFVSNGKIVVLGGNCHQYRIPNVIAEIFDFATMTWSPLTLQDH